MVAQTLHVEIPSARRASVWPWLVALLSGGCLIVVVAQKLQSIPASLLAQTQELVKSSGFNDIEVRVDGRDIALHGTVSTEQSTVQLIDQLSSVVGVRLVRDQLTTIDPVATARQQTQSFLQALSRIDTSVVAFEAGSVQFTPGSDKALDQLAQLMNTNPDFRIRIEGHTDNTGRESVNLRVSRERAEAVARYLVGHNVSPDQLIAKGYGSTQPLADNTTDNGRARNRRIEISYVD